MPYMSAVTPPVAPSATPAELRVPVVWSDDCLLHEPKGEVWLGVMTPGTELPARAQVIRDELVGAGAPVVPASPHTDDTLRAVHASGLLDFLEHGYRQWSDAGLFDAVAEWSGGEPADRVVPYVFPTTGMLDGLPLREPVGIHGRAGRYGYDTMTLIGPGTWRAARAAVDVALTAVDVVSAGAGAAYALCRPPGHHVTRDSYGGSCYLNNAAIAAQAMRESGRHRVAVVDIDAHHGNGTQMVFYDRSDVFYGSTHVDPGAGWFPHYAGYADESGRGEGAGTNLNLPLPEGTPDDDWLVAVERLAASVESFGADGLVISLGVDAAVDDPESPLRVTHGGYRAAGERLGRLGLPTVAVQEGGYHLPTLGTLVRACLSGLLAGQDAAEAGT
jgi:acetoin utilization deacetylase AcuC-like enzyme